MENITCTTCGLQYKESNEFNHNSTDIWHQLEKTVFNNVQKLRFFLLIHLLFFMNGTIQNYYHLGLNLIMFLF